VRTPDADAQTPGVATFLHADLVGWRHVILALGDEASAQLVGEYQATVSSIVEANRGVVLERIADSVLAVFRNASDATHAANAIRAAMDDFTWPPNVDVAPAIALHSGRWSGDLRRPEASTALYRLTRLVKTGEPRQVLVSHTTAALLEGDRDAPPLRSLGERLIPDFDEPVRIYELIESR
jgi:class 3 adenylate cyclase